MDDDIHIMPGSESLCASKICDFANCPDPFRSGVILQNTPKSHLFYEMGNEEQMHIECYIHLCIEKVLKEIRK